MNKKTRQAVTCGLCGGFLNGLFGSGGGVVVVMLLRRIIADENKAHATSTLIIFIMSVGSLLLYLAGGRFKAGGVAHFLPGGVVGAVAGALWLKDINSDLLRRIFGGVIAASGVVMLLS